MSGRDARHPHLGIRLGLDSTSFRPASPRTRARVLTARATQLTPDAAPSWTPPSRARYAEVVANPSTVTAILALEIVAFAVHSGAERKALLAEAGLGLGDLASRDGRVPLRAIVALFDAAARQTGDDAFGLHLAERAAGRPVHTAAFLIQASATLRQGYESVIRHARLVNDTLEIRLETTGHEARLTYHQHDPDHDSRHGVESTLATLHLRGRLALGRAFQLDRVTFRHAPPAQWTEHARVFGAPLAFDASEDALHFATSLLDEPLPTADQRIIRSIEQLLAEMTAELPRAGDLVASARRALAAGLAEGVTIEALAAGLGLSSRVLQRRLRAEGSSYNALLDDLRRELAVGYLRRPTLALAEVAYLLGFSEQSAFQRAFRRWTGMSPARWRRGAPR